MSQEPIKALCWTERSEPESVYPDGINGAVADALREAGIEAETAQLSDPDQGLSEEALARADVLFYWAHSRHGQVTDDATARVLKHVLARGMGFVPLHSALHSKPFRAILGTTGNIAGWREEEEAEHVYIVEPSHPIAEGLGQKFTLPEAEMYVEPFDIPTPDSVVMISSFREGEVFRTGCCWERGLGRIFYFRPGHETYRVLFEEPCRKVFVNAAKWAARRV